MEELFEKLQRKQEAAAKFDCERRREAAAKGEAIKAKQLEKQSALEERKRAEEHRSQELSAQIDRRLQSAAARRQRCLDLIIERTGPGAGLAAVSVTCALPTVRQDALMISSLLASAGASRLLFNVSRIDGARLLAVATKWQLPRTQRLRFSIAATTSQAALVPATTRGRRACCRRAASTSRRTPSSSPRCTTS
jgi:hypothetical protein